MRSADTAPEAHRFQVEVYRRMSLSRRFELAVELSEDIWQVVASGIRDRHPNYDADTVEWAVKRVRLRDDDLFRQVWPSAPLVVP